MSVAMERSESILRGQREVLARIARGTSLREVLTSVARYSEETTPSMLASILYYEPATGKLRRGGHNTLPDAFADTVDGLQPGPAAGSCGTAAFRRARVVSFDVQSDPLWAAFREFAAIYGIRSAWSTPLLSPSDGTLLGVFGMYYPDTREPSADDLELVDHYSHLAAIAIERHRHDAALRESERQRHRGLLATVAGLAHELNTPLGVARTAESLLTDELDAMGSSDDADRVRASAALIRTNLARATDLVRSLRESVLEQESDDDALVVVAELARVAVAAARPLSEARSVRISVDVQDEAARVRCAPVRLKQVVESLLSNALTHAYADGGGDVSLSVRRSRLHPDKLELLVEDHGRGMSGEERQRCTEPFYTTRRLEGHSGLGLFLVKHIVEAELRGSLLLDSEPGRGTRWTAVLPRVESTGATEAGAPAHGGGQPS
jgi:signal transduction histidine kinase